MQASLALGQGGSVPGLSDTRLSDAKPDALSLALGQRAKGAQDTLDAEGCCFPCLSPRIPHCGPTLV